ncbi:MAG: vitamin K epoxide reductase family protein [Pyrinomonadaceae bacterium]
MKRADDISDQPRSAVAKLPVAAAIVALVGLVDSVYLTIKHATAEPVPCSIIDGCEQVLTSAYAELGGVPLAAFGAAAYAAAIVLALGAAFRGRVFWTLFGILALVMEHFSLWLIFVQASLIGAFCQFCLLSALTSITLLIIFILSLSTGRGPRESEPVS